MDRNKCIVDYINGQSNSVEGWFYPLDMLLICALDGVQKTCRVAGDMCEVGVYKGKSLALMGMLARDSETVFAFDAFPCDWLAQARQTMARFCPWVDTVQYITGDTAIYSPSALCKILGSHRFRFLHVDAGHEYHGVLHALLLFAPFVSAGGIIMMDDYQDREFPGVAAATRDFCTQAHARPLVPFVSGANKMYLTSPGWAPVYQHALLNHPHLQNVMRLSRIRDDMVLIAASREPMGSEGIAKLLNNDLVDYLAPTELAALAAVAANNSHEKLRAGAGTEPQGTG